MALSRILNKKYFIIIFLAVFVLVFFWSYKLVIAPEIKNNTEIKEVKINGYIINVEIADTLEKQEKGLSSRQSMPENQGMLFVFNDPANYSFWMKDMNFSLDFIWISGNEIVEITRNVKPEDYTPPKVLVPQNKINKVLEVNAGVAEKLGIKEGDKIEF